MVKNKQAKVAFGYGFMRFVAPATARVSVIENNVRSRNKTPSLLAGAIKRPSGGLGLGKALAGKSHILVAVTDNTRKSHLRSILPYLLDKMSGRSRRIDIIIATGLHKILDRDEKAALVGRRVASKYRVLDHDAGPGGVTRLGTTSLGSPIDLDRTIIDHDAIVTVGTVEPHLYAGFSGGAKTVAVGLAGRRTIDHTHGIRFLADPGTRIGSIDGNPFHDTLWEIASKAPISYSVNVANDQHGKPYRIFAGKPRAVFTDAVACARRIYESRVDRAADIVIAGIGHPKDVNLYQASRAINYITNVERPVLKKGGIAIISAAIPDGIGASSAEAAFHEMLKTMASPQKLLEGIARGGCVAGEHRAFMVARSLTGHEIAFVSPGKKKVFAGLPFSHFEDLDGAVSWAIGKHGKAATVHVIPHALSTIANTKER